MVIDRWLGQWEWRGWGCECPFMAMRAWSGDVNEGSKGAWSVWGGAKSQWQIPIKIPIFNEKIPKF